VAAAPGVPGEIAARSRHGYGLGFGLKKAVLF
jgi:hypothetical protein